MCAVLENAALLYASGQSKPARELLEQGVQTDQEASSSPLAWLALFDLQQRAGDRAAFDKLALLYVVQFERSPPAWEEGGKQPCQRPRRHPAVTPRSPASSPPRRRRRWRACASRWASRSNRRASICRRCRGSTTPARGCSPKLLAEARKRRTPLKLERYDKLRNALDILVRRGRDAGEGGWLLSLELLQFENKQEAFDDRAIEYAVAFEQSPPSWEPPPAPPSPAATPEAAQPSAAASEGAAGQHGRVDGLADGCRVIRR